MLLSTTVDGRRISAILPPHCAAYAFLPNGEGHKQMWLWFKTPNENGLLAAYILAHKTLPAINWVPACGHLGAHNYHGGENNHVAIIDWELTGAGWALSNVKAIPNYVQAAMLGLDAPVTRLDRSAFVPDDQLDERARNATAQDT